MDCANHVSFCRAKMSPCDFVGKESTCPMHSATCGACRTNVPTIGEIERMYVEMCGSMNDHNLEVLRELHKFVAFLGLDDSASVEVINYDNIESYVNAESVKNVTRLGKSQRLQCLCGKRARVFYRRKGFDVRQVDVPTISDDTKAYKTLPREKLYNVMAWYRGLQFREDRRGRIFAMMMSRYAMRNGDVARLTWSNFEQTCDGWRLRYVPHKTEKATAGRDVTIWLDMMDQIELTEWKGDAGDSSLVIPSARYRRGMSVETLERGLNRELRTIGFGGSKGLYELRKLCIDTVFHLYGAEYAAAYSGDDYGTVKFHYADPSSLNLRGINDASFEALYRVRAA